MNLRDSVNIKDEMEVKTIRAGQVSAYKDSIYEYQITTSLDSNVVENYCTTKLHKCINKSNYGCFDGFSRYPFRLESYYSFREWSTIIKENPPYEVVSRIYKYTVCEPYCD